MVSKEQIDRIVDAIESVEAVSIGNTDLPHDLGCLAGWLEDIANTLKKIEAKMK
jgi:hypothetical protein